MTSGYIYQQELGLNQKYSDMKALPEGILHDHISAVNSKKTGKLFKFI